MRRTLLISAFAALLLLSGGCTIEPPLHLRKTVQTKVVLTTQVRTEIMWQADWRTRWSFPWNEALWGPVEYTVPQGMRMHIYTLGPTGSPVSHNIYNFSGLSGEVSIFIGKHDLLFHNNISEVNLFRSETELDDLYAYTRIISTGLKGTTPVRTLSQKEAATKADDSQIPEESVAYAPDELFSLFKPEFEISDDMSRYEFIDGKYVIRINGDMSPVSYIYLIQINLVNNHGRVIGCFGGAALTGVAPEVNLKTRMTGSDPVTIPTDVRINREVNPDVMGIRLLSFGIPGCNPYDAQSVAEAPEGKNFLVLSITYNDYTYKNIRVDVTDQFRALPTGGVISIDLDVDDFPPESSVGPVSGNGGFNPLIDQWDEETGSTSILS